MAAVLKEIKLFRTEMSWKTDRLDVKMDLFQACFAAMDARIQTLEDRLSALEDRLPPMEVTQDDHAGKIGMLVTAVDGLENRGRRNNVRVIGVGGQRIRPPSRIL